MEPTRESIQPLLEKATTDLEPSEYTQTPEQILAFDFETMNQRMILVLDSIVRHDREHDCWLNIVSLNQR